MYNDPFLDGEIIREVKYYDNTWKFKQKLIHPDVFSFIEEKYKIKFPEDLKELIINCNGSAFLEKSHFKLNGKEEEFCGLISFSKYGQFFVCDDVLKKYNVLYFGYEKDGNFVCYDLKTSKIVVYFFKFRDDYDGIVSTNMTLDEFLKSLY